MSAVYRAREAFRNSSVQLNLRSQHKKAAKKQDGRLYRRTFSLHRTVCRLPGQLRQVDQPSGLSASLTAIGQLPGLSRRRQRLQSSRLPSLSWYGQYPVSCRPRASKRYILIASNSLLSTGNTLASRHQPATHRRHDYHRQTVTAIGDATTATGNATTAISNTPPPSLPATPRPLPATLQPLPETPRLLSVAHHRHRFRQSHDRCRKRHGRYW